jgi:hypothetical protein
VTNGIDFFLLRTDSLGDSVWAKLYGGPRVNLCYDAVETPDGGFAVAGDYEYPDGQDDFYLVRTDAGGDTLWTRTYGGQGNNGVRQIELTDDGGFVLAGVASELGDGTGSAYLVRTDSDGDTLWTRTYGTPQVEQCTAMRRTSDGGYVMAGYTLATGHWDVFVIKTATDPVSVSRPRVLPPAEFALSQNYPNPFNSSTTLDFILPRPSRVSIRACDILGRDVGTISDALYPSGRHTILWQCPTCASGTYWISMRGDGFHLVRKAILLR